MLATHVKLTGSRGESTCSRQCPGDRVPRPLFWMTFFECSVPRSSLLAVVLTASLAASQQPPASVVVPQDASFVISQTVRRVRVDVVVTDSQGHPVQGLKANDFHVLEDGRPQPLRQFE